MTRLAHLLRSIEGILGNDIGGRGIAAITLPGQLLPAARAFLRARKVVVLTGFPCRINDSPPTETDGPPGAVALAKAARKLGKPSAIVTDTTSEAVMAACVKAAGLAEDPDFKLICFPPKPVWTEADAVRLAAVADEYDHAVAIERSGRAVDGSYYTMRGFSMDHLVAPVDELLTIGTAAGGHAAPTRTSTGIGDGGNECGMGKVLGSVQAHIRNGEKIACAIPCDHLITAGVSNWGGWGLVAAVEALARLGGEEGEAVAAALAGGASLLPSEAEEVTLGDAMIASAARDGITGACDASVDGMPLSTHLRVLASLRRIGNEGASAPAAGAVGVTGSCPGKVLLVGGYLVLQDGLPGLVVSASSRFETAMRWTPTAAAESGNAAARAAVLAGDVDAAAAALASVDVSTLSPLTVSVSSPQFHSAWRYTLDVAGGNTPFLSLIEPLGRNNPYFEFAFNTALAAVPAAGAGDVSTAAGRLVTLLRAASAGGLTVSVTLRAHNDFYSQREHLLARGLPVCSASLKSLPHALPCPVDPATGKAVVAKTGLGSSAALVSSVVTATTGFFGGDAFAPVGYPAAAPSPLHRRAIHDASQVAHGLAQGKIGSGFDVCSATFGSIRYERIPSAVLGAAMEALDGAMSASSGGLVGAATLLRDIFAVPTGAAAGGASSPAATGGAPAWSFSATPFKLPRGLCLMLADVAAGSETPSMVRQVLAWRDAPANASSSVAAEAVVEALAADEAAALPAGVAAAAAPWFDAAAVAAAMTAAAGAATGPLLWRQLAAANARVEVLMRQFGALHAAAAAGTPVGTGPASLEAYDAAFATCGSATPAGWAEAAVTNGCAVSGGLALVAAALASCRRLLRAMGDAAGVPIEPPAQTALADATAAIPGVVAAGVPGAGGNDALYAVVIEAGGGKGEDSEGGPVRAAVEGAWLAWPGGGLTPLLVRDGPGAGDAGAGATLTFA